MTNEELSRELVIAQGRVEELKVNLDRALDESAHNCRVAYADRDRFDREAMELRADNERLKHDVTEARSRAEYFNSDSNAWREALLGCYAVATGATEPSCDPSPDETSDAVEAGFTALRDTIARYTADAERLAAENSRLQRACDEGLPRERIDCPACGKMHVEGPRHDNPAIDGRTRPHHTHRCYHCGHVFDTGRWSFGADVADDATELDAATALIAKQATILTGVANALHGGESPLVMWSHHDLAELAATMVAELETRRGSRIVNDALFAAANADVDRIGQRVARLEAAEASRAGRTTPPTDAEVAAHGARGGSWRCIVTINGEIERSLCSDLNRTPPSSALVGFPRRRGSVYIETWWALDARGRACAWPIVEVQS